MARDCFCLFVEALRSPSLGAREIVKNPPQPLPTHLYLHLRQGEI
jgi:hypothetical protein